MLIGGLAEQVRVSAAVAAFLVGVALSDPIAERGRELLLPIRDVFGGLFFVFFGLQVDPATLPPVLLPALGLAASAPSPRSQPASGRPDGTTSDPKVAFVPGSRSSPEASSPSSSPASPSPPTPNPNSGRLPPAMCSSSPSPARSPCATPTTLSSTTWRFAECADQRQRELRPGGGILGGGPWDHH
ncbi:MAG: cation:proton antiporter [Microthrixaceae bacterium]|nr:cation:proton antiporter [Microthrixaceae bacterium]